MPVTHTQSLDGYPLRYDWDLSFIDRMTPALETEEHLLMKNVFHLGSYSSNPHRPQDVAWWHERAQERRIACYRYWPIGKTVGVTLTREQPQNLLDLG